MKKPAESVHSVPLLIAAALILMFVSITGEPPPTYFVYEAEGQLVRTDSGRPGDIQVTVLIKMAGRDSKYRMLYPDSYNYNADGLTDRRGYFWVIAEDNFNYDPADSIKVAVMYDDSTYAESPAQAVSDGIRTDNTIEYEESLWGCTGCVNDKVHTESVEFYFTGFTITADSTTLP